jgi:hypothetical protein
VAATFTVSHGGGTATVTVSETGFCLDFYSRREVVSGPGNATVGAAGTSGPSEMFTITGGANTTLVPCAIIFSDGTGQTTPLAVNVN